MSKIISLCHKYGLFWCKIFTTTVREALQTQLQVKMYIPDFRYNINFTYGTSYKFYIPNFRLICTYLISYKSYGCVKFHRRVFVVPLFSVLITMYVCLFWCLFDVIYKYVWWPSYIHELYHNKGYNKGKRFWRCRRSHNTLSLDTNDFVPPNSHMNYHYDTSHILITCTKV